MNARAIGIATLALAGTALGQEIWSGYDFEFTKPDGADWTLPEFQDRITDLVWLTRQTAEGLFNFASESEYAMFESPIGTEWAFGTTADIDSLEFDCWECVTDSNPRALVGQNAVLHLIDENIFIDIRFTSWSCCRQGGFSYMRGVEPEACRADIDGDGDLTIFDFLGFQNLFDAGDLAADFDGDGDLTLFDFLAFQNDFDTGCG